MPAYQGDAGAKIPLSVSVGDEALALRARDVVGKVENARSGWCSGTGGNGGVILGRPADSGQVESGVLGRAVISKAAEAGVYADDGVWRHRPVVAESGCAAVVFFRAAIRAQSRCQRVDGQIQHVPIAVPEEDMLVIGYGMIEAPNHLVLVAAAAGCRRVVIGEEVVPDHPRRSGSRGCWEKL